VTVRINPSLDSNGAPIKVYKLFRDSGDNASDVNTPISAYDGSSTTYKVDGLSSGKIYRFSVKANNSEGDSPVSELAIFAAASLPTQPTIITKNTTMSSETKLNVQWPRVPDTEIPTSGYILEMAEKYGSQNFTAIYSGVNAP
jgi:hypothetical protein